METLKDINQNPVCKNVYLAGFSRNFGSTAVNAFLPVFFMKTFPHMQSQYCILNAFIYTLLGFASNMLGGLLSDYYEKKKNYRAKARICVFGNLMAIPLTGVACLAGNFWVAMTCFALKILVSGGHFAPSVTMM
jgi:MFS family permease